MYCIPKAMITVFCLLALSASLASAEDVEVTQKDKTFLPGKVTLNVGDTLVFHNEDPITHNMFSRSKHHEFNLKMQEPGVDKRQKFEKAGEVLVRCAIHPQMKLVVKVVEPQPVAAPKPGDRN